MMINFLYTLILLKLIFILKIFLFTIEKEREARENSTFLLFLNKINNCTFQFNYDAVH